MGLEASGATTAALSFGYPPRYDFGMCIPVCIKTSG